MAEKQKTILCVDDHYDSYYAAREEGTLEDRLRAIYDGAPYKLVFVKTYKEYRAALDGDSRKQEISLVVLDFELGFSDGINEGTINAPDISDEILERRPDIKIINLTAKVADNAPLVINGKEKDEVAKKKQMGQRQNSVAYFQKGELLESTERLRNISDSVIEDYYNERWSFLWEPIQKCLTLNKLGGKPITLPINKEHAQVLTWCFREPHCAGWFWGSTANDAVYELNAKVVEATNGKIWALLTTEGMPKSCIKTLALKNKISIKYRLEPPKDNDSESGYAMLREFEGQLKELAEKVEAFRNTQAEVEGLRDEVNFMLDHLKEKRLGLDGKSKKRIKRK